MKPTGDDKKQILLRISRTLYDEVVRMSDAEFRSVNAQIEYVLSRAVQKYRGGMKGDKDSNE